ncbi:MAG: carbohydrate kinase, partial [Candidatus Bathyarchaeota archaeon B63]
MDDDIITTREMRALEINAEYYGVSRLQLMENAGRDVAVEISARFHPKETKVAIFCGLGGNGGDGFVVARHLACLGFEVHVILAGRASQIVNEEARRNWEALRNLGGSISIYEVHDSSMIPEVEADLIVDALLGTGLSGPPRPPISQMIGMINRADAFRVAVDVPSGIDSDSGEILGEAVKADLTVTFHKAKPGLLKAKDHVGELVVKHIGLPSQIERLAGPGDVVTVVKPRPPEAHKGDFGRLLIVGGSEAFSGAPALAALAALRAGVDLAYVAAPRDTAYAISSMSPDMITLKLEGSHLNRENLPVVRRFLEKASAVVIGPGLGLHRETIEAVDELIKDVERRKMPLLLDADGLKAFSGSKRRLETPAVLTPHAGEYR